MNLPNRIKLSKKATDRLRMLRQRTGVTPNVLARVAIMKALEASTDLSNAGVNDADGQELNRDVLFGDLTSSFELLLQFYIEKNHIVEPTKDVVAALIEIGVHKIGHIKTISDLALLNDGEGNLNPHL